MSNSRVASGSATLSRCSTRPSPRHSKRRTATTQIATTAPSSGATRSADVTPILITLPTASPVSMCASDADTRTRTAMAVDDAAATGAPMASARPTTTASMRDPRAAGASPAPSNASAGIAIAVIARATVGGRPALSGAARAAISITPPRRVAARIAPRRAIWIVTRRCPVGSGRQFGDHGFAGPMVEMYLSGAVVRCLVATDNVRYPSALATMPACPRPFDSSARVPATSSPG
jgi:hypothetical protein